MNGNKLTVGSLFAGIGGIDLGLERTGHFETIWFSEIDTYASKVLAKHWPNVPNYGDIKAIDYGSVTRPDIITGGYPCQPFSTAGKRAGENDPRHLWPECLRAIRQLRPRYALLENVRGHLSLGFSQVLTDLASIGFDAEWQVIPAGAVGAPHKRDRLFIVAYPEGYGQWRGHSTDTGTLQEWAEIQLQTGRSSGIMAHPEGSNGRRKESHGLQQSERKAAKLGNPSSGTRPQHDWWEIEPSVGQVANGVSSRVDRLRCLGNAVVPQVAELLGNLIWDHSQNA